MAGFIILKGIHALCGEEIYLRSAAQQSYT